MLKRIVHIFSIIYASYLAVCLLILLPAMNILAPRLVQEYTGRTLASELILFNPFTLALELRGVALNARENDEPELLAFKRLQVNLSTASLWASGLVLDQVLLDELRVDIRQLEDGSFNFSDLVPAQPREDDEEDGGLPSFTVHRLEFQADHLGFSDESRSPVYRTHMDDLAFSVTGLSTVREEGSPYQLTIVTEHGGRLDWRGDLSLARQHSAGDLRLGDIDLRPVYRYLEPTLAFVVDSALLDVSGTYSATWKDAPGVTLQAGRVALRQLKLRPRDAEALPDTYVNLDEISIGGIAASSADRRLHAERITLDALDVSGFSENDEHSLLPLFLAPDTAASGGSGGSAAEAVTTVPDSEKNQSGEAPWQFTLQRFTTDNTRLRWRSAYTEPDRIELSPVRVDARDLAWPAQGPSRLDLSLLANGQSQLTVSGSLDVGSGDGSLDYRLQQQPLAWFNPLLDNVLQATIDGGELSVDGNLTLAGFAPSATALDSRVDDFALRIFGRESSASSWKSLSVPGIRIDFLEPSVATDRIVLDGYRGSLHILPDGRLNVQMALADPTENATADAPPTSARAADPAAPTSTTAAGAGEWAVSIAGLQLTDAGIDFEDETLPIAFRTLIGQLTGEIGALDSARSAVRTPVGLEGAVDGYAPVTIQGNISPFADATALAIQVRFRGVDLANLSPYSATYAGYAIDSGTLNLDLAYTLDGDRLQGDNRAVISRMVLGEPVKSERALELPLKLALALLTDTRGVIDLEVPIEGSIDSPEFSLGKIIGRTLRNILTKTVTAPFRFLAGLVGSDADLQQMEFMPGSDTYDAATAAKLDSLAEALAQRPALKVLVRGSIDPQADVRALRVQTLEQQLLAGGRLTIDAIEAQTAAWEIAVAERYRAVFGNATRDGEATVTADEPSAHTMRDALLEGIEVPRETLDALVRTRASAIKRHLVNTGGIAADRVTLSGRAEEARLAGAVLDVSS